MVRKTLILIACMVFVPAWGWAIEDVCTSEYDNDRYEEKDYDCLIQYREAFNRIQALYQQTKVNWAQPPDNIVNSDYVDYKTYDSAIGFAQPPDNINFRSILLNPFFAQPPDN